MLENMRLLLVEDDEFQRSELSQYLKRRVKKIYIAQNGEEGFLKYQDLKPDVIITDLRMPKLDGLGLLKKIRKEDRITPVIIISAMNDKETILNSLEFGISNYLVKPVDVKELMEVLTQTSKLVMDIKGAEFLNGIENQRLNDIKTEMTSYVKKETGKGPGDVRVNIQGKSCLVELLDILTTYEKSFLVEAKNQSLIDHNRIVFFKDRSEMLESIITKHLSIPVILKRVECDSSLKKCILTFEL